MENNLGLDKEVAIFARFMQNELNANKEKKGDWRGIKNLTKWELIRELDHHRDKLVKVMLNQKTLFEDLEATDRIAEFSADIANCAMFIAYANKLLEEDSF